MPNDFETVIRRIIREETGLTSVAPAEKWRGGQLVLRPGKPGVQEKAWPIETFFNKVVMLRNRLRTLEQQVNASELPDDQKLKLQAYITGCYGSLTSFNVLFADDEDRFVGRRRSTSIAGAATEEVRDRSSAPLSHRFAAGTARCAPRSHHRSTSITQMSPMSSVQTK
jgi:hypothetical protein